MSELEITQIRSRIGQKHNQRATLDTLGLKRIQHTVRREDTPNVRGMLKVVHHLVRVEEVSS